MKGKKADVQQAKQTEKAEKEATKPKEEKTEKVEIEKPKEEAKPEAPKEEVPKEVVEKKEEVEKKIKEAPKKIEPEKSKSPNLAHVALFLHSAGQTVSEDNLKKVVKAAGVSVDDAQIKSLVSSLKNVDIDEAIKQTAVTPVAPAPTEEKKAEVKEEKKEEKKAEEAVSGLSSLFG